MLILFLQTIQRYDLPLVKPATTSSSPVAMPRNDEQSPLVHDNTNFAPRPTSSHSSRQHQQHMQQHYPSHLQQSSSTGYLGASDREDSGRCCCCLNIYWLSENMRFCGLVLSYNWQSLFLWLLCFFSFVGESIFRKSVASNLFNYRFSVLILINVLTFLCLIAAVAMDRCARRVHKSRRRRSRRSQLLARQMRAAQRGGNLQVQGMQGLNLDLSELTNELTETSESAWMTQSHVNSASNLLVSGSSGAAAGGAGGAGGAVGAAAGTGGVGGFGRGSGASGRSGAALLESMEQSESESSRSDASVISSDDTEDGLDSSGDDRDGTGGGGGAKRGGRGADLSSMSARELKRYERRKRKKRERRRKKRKEKNKGAMANFEIGTSFTAHWRYYAIIGFLDVLHMLFVFIPIGVLPGNIGILVPFVGVALNCLLACCLACEGNANENEDSTQDSRRSSGKDAMESENNNINSNNNNRRERRDGKQWVRSWQAVIGSVFVLVSLYVLIFVDCSSLYKKSGGEGWDRQYATNLILLVLGCIPLSFCNFYKEKVLRKSKIKNLSRLNAYVSGVTLVLLVACAPFAYKLQYVAMAAHETSHGLEGYDDLAPNLYNCLHCLVGSNSYDSDVKDVCDKVVGWPLLHFVCYVVFMLCNRVFSQKLINEAMSGQAIQHLMSGASLVAFCLCYVQIVQQLWDPHDSGLHIFDTDTEFTWHTGIVCGLMMFGLFIVYQRPTLKFGQSGDDSAWIVED